MSLRTNKFAMWYYQFLSKLGIVLFGPKRLKSLNEITFWKIQKWKEKTLGNDHYEPFFTSFFDFTKEDYAGKKVLDIGCGPRGSLEWANNTEVRIGLDPLADKYVKMEGKNHQMEYRKELAENMSFEDGYFDFVTSLNSLDHVDDLQKSISEIKRVVKTGGYFLLISDIHEKPTMAEPSNFGWDISESFQPEFDVVWEKHFEGDNMYKSLRENIPFDHSNKKSRYGIIAVKFKKN